MKSASSLEDALFMSSGEALISVLVSLPAWVADLAFGPAGGSADVAAAVPVLAARVEMVGLVLAGQLVLAAELASLAPVEAVEPDAWLI